MTLVLFLTFSISFVELSESVSVASEEDITKVSVIQRLLKCFANHVTDPARKCLQAYTGEDTQNRSDIILLKKEWR